MTRRLRSWAAAVVVAGAVCVGASGCESGENMPDRQEQVHAENLAKQRESALAFISNHPDAETIRFTQEGGRPGLGATWRVNAVVTIGGREYQEILGPESRAGEPLPAPSSASTIPVVVVYSDGSSEVLG